MWIMQSMGNEMVRGNYLVFHVGQCLCALPCGQVGRILLLPALDRPPNLPAAIEGVLNHAGTAIPVVRLDRLFGLPCMPQHAYQHVVVPKLKAERESFKVNAQTERDKIRAELLKEMKQAPRSTAVSTSATRATTTPPSGPRKLEDVIAESLKALK